MCVFVHDLLDGGSFALSSSEFRLTWAEDGLFGL